MLPEPPPPLVKHGYSAFPPTKLIVPLQCTAFSPILNFYFLSYDVADDIDDHDAN